METHKQQPNDAGPASSPSPAQDQGVLPNESASGEEHVLLAPSGGKPALMIFANNAGHQANLPPHQHYHNNNHQYRRHHQHQFNPHHNNGPAPPHVSSAAGPLPIPCKFFAMGMCKFGESCRFAHFRGGWSGRGAPRGGRGGSRGGRGGDHSVQAEGGHRGPSHMGTGSTGEPAPAAGGAHHPHHHAPTGPHAGGHQPNFVPRGGRGYMGGPAIHQQYFMGGRGGRGGRGGHHPHFAGGRGGFMGGNYYRDQRPYGKPPGTDFERKEEQKQQLVDYFIVLDLEGKHEVLEFPAALVNAKSLEVEDTFHRYVRPVTFSDEQLSQYITGKYGKHGLVEQWQEGAMAFTDVLLQFHEWLVSHELIPADEDDETGEEKKATFSFIFVTCGNWDIKTQIPRQCAISKFDVPNYFHEWVNLKDIYLNFYKHKALGMRAMLAGLGIPLEGEYHNGKDDVQSICKIVVRMVKDGALVEPTAKRAMETGYITYKYQHRV